VPRPIHFEIHASDPERVQAFYRTLFGWQFQAWNGPAEGWLAYVKDPDGNLCGLMQADSAAR